MNGKGVDVCRCYPEPAAPPPAGSPPGRTSEPLQRPSGLEAAAQKTFSQQEADPTARLSQTSQEVTMPQTETCSETHPGDLWKSTL